MRSLFAIAALACTLVAPGMSAAEYPDSMSADPRRGELAARVPSMLRAREEAAGLVRLSISGGGPALIYVPEQIGSGKPIPLLLMLHGAGGTPHHSIDLVRRHADSGGFIVLAPKSRGSSWDIISERRYGSDVRAIDSALDQVFSRYPIDGSRVAVGGFSDGASYALSLGIANGDLFSRVIAFSPGFMAPMREQGTPEIFISHGVQDTVLPIARCSRKLAPQIREAGYRLDYREFPGGHIVPENLARAAFAVLVR